MIKLDETSQRIATALFDAFPEWRQFQLKEVPEIFKTPIKGSLIVRVPSPVRVSSPKSGNWLLVDTCDGEVTVTYDCYHTHFGDDLARNGMSTPLFPDLIAFLQSFVREEVAIAVAMSGDEWMGADTFVPSENSDPASQFSESADRIYMRSWNGSFDQDLMGEFNELPRSKLWSIAESTALEPLTRRTGAEASFGVFDPIRNNLSQRLQG